VLARATDRSPPNVPGKVPGRGQRTGAPLSCGACRHGAEAAATLLPQPRVSGDVAARLRDVAGDGRAEIVLADRAWRAALRLSFRRDAGRRAAAPLGALDPGGGLAAAPER
jgi:hypothetical protein